MNKSLYWQQHSINLFIFFGNVDHLSILEIIEAIAKAQTKLVEQLFLIPLPFRYIILILITIEYLKLYGDYKECKTLSH